jgi:hypothetical protein
MIGQIKTKQIKQTAEELTLIIEASKIYRLKNPGTWPASMAVLATQGYIDPSWATSNPWGNAYSYSTAGDIVQVTTIVPSDTTTPLVQITPNAFALGVTSVAVVGQTPSRELAGGNIIKKTGPLADRTMGDHLLMNNNKVTNIGTATLASDGLSATAGDGPFVNLTGDTMTGPLIMQSPAEVDLATFRDRSDPSNYYVQPAGTSQLNRPNIWDMYIRPWGQWVSQLQGSPQYWQCTPSAGGSSACCPTGYTPMSAALNYWGGACQFYSNGSQMCAQCPTPTVSLMCCK